MNRSEITRLMEETIKEVYDENPELSDEVRIPEYMQLAARLSTVVTLRVLDKIGVINLTD